MSTIKAIDSQALGVKARLRQLRNLPDDFIYKDADLTKGTAGAIVGTLDRVLDGKNNRYLVLGWLFNESPQHLPMSSKELVDGEWYALYKWVGFWKNEQTDKWQTAENFEQEALAVLSAAIRNLYDAGVDEQQFYGRDPLSIVDNAVGELGGKVTKIVKADTGDEGESKPVVIPKSLRNTRFGQNRLTKDKERRLLKELGYNPDEENVNF